MDQLRGLNALDVGCGGGILAEALARLGANVTAIDPAAENVKVARAHSELCAVTRNINYICTTVDEMEKTGAKFDIVCSLEVIEHVSSVPNFLRSCTSCVGDDGDLFLSTINRTHKSYGVAILGAEYISGVVPRGTHDWQKFLSPREVNELLSKSGFKAIAQNGLVLDESPFTLAHKLMRQRGDLRWALSASDLDVNYILHATKA